jgi:hypothetical protein
MKRRMPASADRPSRRPSALRRRGHRRLLRRIAASQSTAGNPAASSSPYTCSATNAVTVHFNRRPTNYVCAETKPSATTGQSNNNPF